jgi:putative inorganic carbon (HCO3(-)) transporter
VTPLSKKALWILAAILAATTAAMSWSEWVPPIVAVVFVFFVILISGMDALNNLFFISIPLSIELGIPGVGDLMFPSELIAVIIFCFTAVNMMAYRKIWRTNDYHPASAAFLMLWAALCYATYESNLPIVSIKTLIIFTIYLTTFYLQWFLYPKEATLKIKRAIFCYFIGIAIVCLYTTIKHSASGFDRMMAMRMPPPFFSDHTIYGTCLAFFIPMLYYWIKTTSSTLSRIFYITVMALFSMAIFTTYSRAVWMSLVVVLVVYYLLKIKIPIKKLTTALVVFLVLVVFFQDSAVEFLSQNRSDSKARKAEVSDQLKSVGNISTDVSNLERINRWKSAISMLKDKPLSGHGPGTYQFNFIVFQKPEDKTPISVNRASDHFSQGLGGTAHSQYLLYAAESGIFALIAFVAAVLYTVKEAFNLYYNSTDEKEKLYIKALLGGYITFVFHSFFNNFLDIDKSASLFFIFNAGIILLAIEKKRALITSKTIQTNGN